MSGEQSQQSSATTASAEPAMTEEHRWGEPISAERQAELQAVLDAWNASGADHGGRPGPFAVGRLAAMLLTALAADHGNQAGPSAVRRLTGADVSWLAEQSGPSGLGQVPNLHLETLLSTPSVTIKSRATYQYRRAGHPTQRQGISTRTSRGHRLTPRRATGG
jgi:hypothetical protein